MLTSLLAQEPHLRGVVFDLPHLRDETEATIDATGVRGRCTFEGGSFFERVGRIGVDVEGEGLLDGQSLARRRQFALSLRSERLV